MQANITIVQLDNGKLQFIVSGDTVKMEQLANSLILAAVRHLEVEKTVTFNRMIVN